MIGTIGIMPYSTEIAVLKKFFVYEGYQGKPNHVGKKLYDVLLAFVKENGYKTILLDTPHNTERKQERVFEEIRALFSINAEDGFSQEEVDAVCKKHGSLPEILKQYYLELGKVIPLNQQQNRLLAPGDLIDAGEYLIFYVENQYVAQWAIKKSSLELGNPPVYCALDEKNFKPECENLYDFLCAMANFQAASWGLTYSSEEIYYLKEEQLKQIASCYRKKSYELHQWIEIAFYGNREDEVICVLGGEQMTYASSNGEHFKELEQFLGKLNLEVL